MNRKFIGILLFLCFLAPAVTTYIYLQYKKEIVKESVKSQIFAGMDRDQLVLLKFTEAEKKRELDWEHSKEFEYRGEMYDVVEFEVKGDTTYYLCFEDKKETRVKAHIRELVANILGNNPQNQENGKRIQNFFKSLYCSNSTEISILPFQEIKTKYHFKSDSFQSQKQPPPAPPPDMS